MLLITHGKEIPVLKRALPVFEDILARKALYMVPSQNFNQVPAQSQSQDKSMSDAYALPHTNVSLLPSHLDQYEGNPPLYEDFLGFDFLDEWQIGQMDFTSQR